MTNYMLNNSKIKLFFATSHFRYGNYIVENKGFPPDIYFDCEADEILSTLQNFINENTNLKCPSLKALQKYDYEALKTEQSK